MKKIINPCKVKIGKQFAQVFCKIEYTNARLSITGVIGPNRWGNARGGCGQIDMEFAHRNPKDNDPRYTDLYRPGTSDMQLNNGWNRRTWYNFLDAWKNHRMNDLHAECEHQHARGETYDTHPGAVCPECGWKLGHGWKMFPVPQDVIDFLSSLPNTERTPAWV